MNIYLVYKDGIPLYPTTLPRIVQDAFKGGADTVEVWRNERLIKRCTSAKEFNRFINPPSGEDDEQAGGNGYEW